jgi:hypothetical protein
MNLSLRYEIRTKFTGMPVTHETARRMANPTLTVFMYELSMLPNHTVI